MSEKEKSQNRRVDIKTLAKACGYSVGTVSMALNGSPMVKKSTSERVLAKAAEMGYVPNIIAQLIATKNSGTIGVVVPNSLPPLFPSIIYGIHQTFEASNRRAFVVYTMDNPDNELYFLKVFGQLRVSGLIAAPCPGSKAAAELEFLQKDGVKIVLIDRTLPEFTTDYCGFDHHGQAKALTEHLLNEGHRRIAVAGASLSYSVIDERKAGFWEAMAEAGVPRSSYLEMDLDYDHAPVRMDEHERNVAKFIDYLGGVRPSALVLALDGLLPSVEEAARAVGMSIPEDLVVFSFDNLHTKVPNSGVVTRTYRPGAELGRRSADLLLQRMENGDEETPEPKRELIEAQHSGWSSAAEQAAPASG